MPWSTVIKYGLIVLVLSLVVGGLGYFAFDAGKNRQAKDDASVISKLQGTIDATNVALANQKTAAQSELTEAEKRIAEAETANLDLNRKLEAANETAHRAVAARGAMYAATGGLRFAVALGSNPVRRGDGGIGARAPAGPAALAAVAAYVELPNAITNELRSLSTDADQLAVDYGTCFAYALGQAQKRARVLGQPIPTTLDGGSP
jgi:hypothetical protein